MRIAVLALIGILGCSASAEAGCRTEGSYPGTIKAGAKSTRTFHLINSGIKSVMISVVAESLNDKVKMRVVRPGGAAGCRTRGPGSDLSCNLTIRRTGDHKVVITNVSRNAVTYSMQCWNAP